MNLRQREVRVIRSDQMRHRALHDAARLREALALIADLAEGTTSALTLPDIARIARAALVGAEPADPRQQSGAVTH
ncbi:hypothetical protein OKW43_005173 [Paraburkholderia sp. WC7.3g]|uniref:hypothetical protein n=1 Tax=unclassified Paraburkholderia TaxID=2615204 RepID=UPI001607B4A0|nr:MULTISPECIES: hypothetical protein [unclassified Paraburkholderia]MBB5411672.1 hypothetical protein [Paraburkholderia sp. HC6.4b]MBB5453299.1 hypothetical protein [Paraburkholderia sp. Kb1A]MBC8724554.1 hypothetical protein [Paraburkholderia sp. 31.1]MBC8729417.1 hypothetical protein [Paraburkholderia sp. UCT2]